MQTLVLTDIATGWTECGPWLLRKQTPVRAVLGGLRKLLPFDLLAWTTMAVVDWALTGGAVLTWWVVPIMLAAGFVTPLPYNYWRLKALGKACH